MNKYAVINVNTARKDISVIDAEFSTLKDAIKLAKGLSWVGGKNLVLTKASTIPNPSWYDNDYRDDKKLKFFTLIDFGGGDYLCSKYFVTKKEAEKEVAEWLEELFRRKDITLFDDIDVYMEVIYAAEV